MIVIKLTYNHVTRRLPREEIPSFNSLINVCRNIFRIDKSQKVMITYIDDDNDIISIGSDSELVEAFRQLNPSSSALKLFIHPDNEEEEPANEEDEDESIGGENESIGGEDESIVEEDESIGGEDENHDDIEEEKEDMIQEKQLSLLCSIENFIQKFKREEEEEKKRDSIESKLKDFIDYLKKNLVQFFSSINEKIIQPISNAAKIKISELKSLLSQIEIEIKGIKMRIIKRVERRKKKVIHCRGKSE